MTLITLSSDFIADATRAHVDRDPRNNIGCEVINDLADALQKPASQDRAHRAISTQPIQQQGVK